MQKRHIKRIEQNRSSHWKRPDGLCKRGACVERAVCRGLCWKHYRQWQRSSRNRHLRGWAEHLRDTEKRVAAIGEFMRPFQERGEHPTEAQLEEFVRNLDGGFDGARDTSASVDGHATAEGQRA